MRSDIVTSMAMHSMRVSSSRRTALFIIGGFYLVGILVAGSAQAQSGGHSLPVVPVFPTSGPSVYNCHDGTNGWGYDYPYPPNVGGNPLCNSEELSGRWRVGYFSAQDMALSNAPVVEYSITTSGNPGAYTISFGNSTHTEAPGGPGGRQPTNTILAPTTVYANAGDPIKLQWSFQPELSIREYVCTSSFLGICLNSNNETVGSYTFFNINKGIVSNFGTFSTSTESGSMTIVAPAQSTTYTIGGVVGFWCAKNPSWKDCQPPLSIPIVIGHYSSSVPSLSFASNPVSVGQNTTVTWSVANASSCEVYNSDAKQPVSSTLYASSTICASPQTLKTPTYSSARTDTYTLYYTDSTGVSYFPTYTLMVNAISSCPVNSSGTYPSCTCNSGYTGAPPDCVAIPGVACPSGYSGVEPNCIAEACPPFTAESPAKGGGFTCTPDSACPVGYTGTPPACVPTPPGVVNSFMAVPSRVRSGGQTTFEWSTENMQACTLKSLLMNSVSVPLISNSFPETITSADTYTLSCIDGNGTTFSVNANVGLIPTVQEK
jgi:hypothetical protein